MKNLNEAVKELEDIVSKNINKYKFPEINGNTVRIGHLLIRTTKQNGFLVVDTKNNKTVETAYSKSAAIAIALANLKNKNYKEILFYDSIIEKNVNDSHFYFSVINNTKELSRKEAILNRFEESKNKIDWARRALDNYILDDIR
jgi:hypothetical protein